MENIIIIVGIAIVIWLILRPKTKKNDVAPNMYDVAQNVPDVIKPVSITEETIFKTQGEFEEHLEQTYLPNAILFQDLYVYRHMMAPWYKQLSGEHRYDEEHIQKIRNDWLAYMEALQDGHSSNYLYLEAKNEEEGSSHRKESIMMAKKARAIEDGFASAIGKEAVAELGRIRGLEWGRISAEGELAPEGFEFDLIGKVRRIVSDNKNGSGKRQMSKKQQKNEHKRKA